MPPFVKASFTDAQYTPQQHWLKRHALPANMNIERAQSQADVHATVLNYLVQKFDAAAPLQTIDLPCGKQEFASHLKQLFPQAAVTGVDIVPTAATPGVRFLEMNISQPFTLPANEQYDLVTSISGVMMFSNTQLFLENCIRHLKKGGTFILTNDNSATLKDKLTYLLFGNLRMFPAVYADTEEVTENVSIQELVRILRLNGITVKDIVYTSSNARDYLLFPLAFPLYLMQRWFLRRFRGRLPPYLIKKMYPFRHLHCRHYSIFGEKQ